MLHINIICVGKLKEKYLQDALSEYSIGNIMSVMKLVFFMLYNPTTGVMIEDKEHCRNESIE